MDMQEARKVLEDAKMLRWLVADAMTHEVTWEIGQY